MGDFSFVNFLDNLKSIADMGNEGFRVATLMLQTFQTMIKEFLGRGSILSDAVGVDGLTYLPSLPLLSLLDGLKPYLL